MDDNGLVFSCHDEEGVIEVVDDLDTRALYFGTSARQSAMSREAPHRLVLSYTRSMLSGLLFTRKPRSALVLGLGGGSLPRFLMHVFPTCRIDVVERRAKVVQVAHDYFHLARSPRLRTHRVRRRGVSARGCRPHVRSRPGRPSRPEGHCPSRDRSRLLCVLCSPPGPERSIRHQPLGRSIRERPARATSRSPGDVRGSTPCPARDRARGTASCSAYRSRWLPILAGTSTPSPSSSKSAWGSSFPSCSPTSLGPTRISVPPTRDSRHR